MFWPVQQTFKEKFQQSNHASVLDDQAWNRRRVACWVLSLTLVEQLLPLVYISMIRWALAWKNQTRKNKFKKIIWAQKTKMSGRNQPNIECRCRLRCVRPNWLSGSLTGAMPIVSFELSAFWGEHFWSIKTKQQPVQPTQPNHTTLATDIQTMMFGGGKQWECITDLVRAVCIHVVAQCRLHILYL